ncbi:MAG TPA: PQQ-dependent sugar dehydrogenase, partial [Pirellulales bacterium]|nr:PQQ-dependent sugar dehydrogenase [Pirellulales bacterium]
FEKLLRIDRGGYDLTFHPDFQNNGYLYIGSNGPTTGASADKTTRVTRYAMDQRPPQAIDARSDTTIIEWPSDGHNGGALAFGHDGMLYVTSGDGTSDSDTNIVGQNLGRLTAKVLRIDVDHPDPGQQYSVPKDNPFVATPGARAETWAYGLRNPWRMTVDRETGHVWVGNNGQDLWEQAYLVRRGDNYGWSVLEGGHPFYLDRTPGPTPFVKPTVEHPHSVARSLTGGVVYYGTKFPQLQGAYIYGDFSTGKIWGVKHDGKGITWQQELADTTLAISGFGADIHGELLIVDYRGENQGGFYTLEPTPSDGPRAEFPRRLGQTGLFKSLHPLVPQEGLVPYSVNAPLWSDGALKERYIAIPFKQGEERRIEFTESHGWNFPDETVLVKSFALELEAGNPASRRWIETRLLTRQEGEWVGYSYLWNDEQTDAVLVEASGTDRDFSIRESAAYASPGERRQTWHYPSRAECMVCHSRAANFVLGLTELQMNKDHDYGGAVDNQLRTLEHLRLLKLAKPLDQYRKLVDPYDERATLDARARSYLHANCAQCHVAAGGGNAKMELEFVTSRDKMNIFDIAPVHDTYKIADARLIAPGEPERSILLARITHRGAGRMPPLASSVVDREAVKLLSDWIRQLKD